MSLAEANEIASVVAEKQKEKMENMRLMMWIIAQVNSSEDIDPQDVIKFSWDNECEDEDSEDDLVEIRKRAEQFKNM